MMREPKWHIESVEALPAEMGSLDDAVDADLLRKSGFNKAAEIAQATAEERRRREAQIPADRLYRRLSEAEQGTLAAHFTRRVSPADYDGEPPTEVANKFVEFRNQEVFESVVLWCAPDGEVLAIGTAHNDDEVRTYLIVQWGAVSAYTTIETLTEQHAETLRRTRGKHLRAVLMVWSFYAMGAFCYGYGFYSMLTGRSTWPVTVIGMYVVLFACPWAVKRMRNTRIR